MAKRKRTAGRTILRLIRYVLALTFCFAAIMITKELTQAHKEQSAFENLASIVEKADSTTRSAIRLTTELPQQAESHESQQLVESHKPSETAEAASPLVEEPVMLPEYADKEYWEQHKTICFDTLYEHGEYEVIAAFSEKPLQRAVPASATTNTPI